jgi:hypothetical protein
MKRVLVIFVAAGIAIGGLLMVGVFGLKIGEVGCESQYGPCSAEVRKLADEASGKNMFAARKRIDEKLGKSSLVIEYTLEFRLPFGLKVEVVENKGEAVVVDATSGDARIIDREGRTVKEAEGSSLPRLVKKDAGVTAEQEAFAGEILNTLMRWKGTKTGEIENEGFRVKTDGGYTFVFPLEGDVDILLGSMNLILSWLNTNGGDTRITLVDLRYKNPVIR